MKNNIKLFLVLMSLVFLFTACEQLGFKSRGIKTSNGLIEVIGNNTVTGTMTINPGTTVKFEETTSIFAGGGEQGELEFVNGGKLLAQGTAAQPIIFENSPPSGGHMYLRDTADNNSIIEYCQIGIPLDIYNSATIQKCKFNDAWLNCFGVSQSTIQYNSFNRTLRYSAASISLDINTICQVKYNNIDSGNWVGIDCATLSPTIGNNNITNTAEAAVYASDSSSVTINSNYIANCNGKTGVDITGIQSRNVIYTNPLTVAVSSAGCSW
jgi:hypothetical protein